MWSGPLDLPGGRHGAVRAQVDPLVGAGMVRCLRHHERSVRGQEKLMRYFTRRISDGGLVGWCYAVAANAVELVVGPLNTLERWLDERGFQATKRWERRTR